LEQLLDALARSHSGLGLPNIGIEAFETKKEGEGFSQRDHGVNQHPRMEKDERENV